jgi:hypothetical protein
MELLNAALILLPWLVVIGLFVTQYLERKDMLDRLMSRNLTDFKANTSPTDPNQLSDEPVDDTIALEDAEEEILKEDDGEE